MNTALLVIDAQYDFHDVPENEIINGCMPALAVPGAWDDSLRLAELIARHEPLWGDIILLQDTHQKYDIAHPTFWKLADGSTPAPFIQVKSIDVANGKITPVDEELTEYAISYIESLESAGKIHFIWPEHCIEGTAGHEIVRPIKDALAKISAEPIYVEKGKFELTEHFGAFEAEVPVDSEPSTKFNEDIYSMICNHDRVLIAGQALSHCVAASVTQLVNRLEKDGHKTEVVLLIDATSPVGGFEDASSQFIKDIEQRGVTITKVADVSF